MSTQTTAAPVPTYSSLVAAEVRAESGRHSVTQRRLAELLGMSQQAVSDRWRGKTPWTFDDVQRVEGALGLEAGAILAEVVRHQGLEPRTRWFGAWHRATRPLVTPLAPVVDLAARRAERLAVAS